MEGVDDVNLPPLCLLDLPDGVDVDCPLPSALELDIGEIITDVCWPLFCPPGRLKFIVDVNWLPLCPPEVDDSGDDSPSSSSRSSGIMEVIDDVDWPVLDPLEVVEVVDGVTCVAELPFCPPEVAIAIEVVVWPPFCPP